MSILSSIGKVVGGATSVGLNPFNAVANKVSGGAFGYDPTAGYSAQNVATTQAGKLLNSGSAAPSSGGDPAVQIPNTYSTLSTAGGGATTDPYAQYGGTTAYNNLVSGFDTQKQNIYGTANDAANNTGIQLNGSIQDLVDQLKAGQSAIDLKGARNELAKQQGVQGILGMVGRGIKSGGVMLANKNAGDSSAAQALATAYGDQGRRQLAGIGNQYELGNQDIALEQANLGTQQAAGVRHIQDSKTQAINGIVADARDKFATLDASMANASLPQRLAIDQERENVRQQVLSSLQQYDAQLQNGVQGIQASSPDQRRAQAAQMASAGTDLGADAFNYTTETPAQFQNTGPFASALPLFTFNGKNKQLA